MRFLQETLVFLALFLQIMLLLTALKVIHEKNWKRLGVLEHLHLPDHAWTLVAVLADHATSFLVLFRRRLFYLSIRFLLVHATGFLVLPHSYSHFLLMLDAPWESRFLAMKM